MYGQHKKDWAKARRLSRRRYWNRDEEESAVDSPLIISARTGNLAAMEWLLSDTPSRLYKEFGSANKDDEKIAALLRADGGFDKAVDDWLSRDRESFVFTLPACHAIVSMLMNMETVELALHQAVNCYDPAKTVPMVQYLLDALPESLEIKDAAGCTPLLRAFSGGNVEVIQILLAAGASQTVRDHDGRNILHLLLVNSATNRPFLQVPLIATALHLVDPALLPELFLERCSHGPTGTTPLAYWILSYASLPTQEQPHSNRYEAALLPILLTHMPAEALSMLDGSGQRPLHQAVKQFRHELVAMLLRRHPALLHMENAMGQTPLELAEALYIQYVTTTVPGEQQRHHGRAMPRALEWLGKLMEKERGEDGDWEAGRRESTWRVCRDRAVGGGLVGKGSGGGLGGKGSGSGLGEEGSGRGLGGEGLRRKLVSVSEAGEVARRLAEREKQRRMEREEERAREAAEA